MGWGGGEEGGYCIVNMAHWSGCGCGGQTKQTQLKQYVCKVVQTKFILMRFVWTYYSSKATGPSSGRSTSSSARGAAPPWPTRKTTAIGRGSPVTPS
jgi:hypothetical protein